MKITIRKDHPMTLLGLIAFGFIVSKVNQGMDDAKIADDTLLIVFLLFIVAAYLIQIRQTVILEEGRLIFVEKKQKVELLLSEIVSVSKKGRKLSISYRSGKMEIDVGLFSKKNLQTLLSHIGDSGNMKPEEG